MESECVLLKIKEFDYEKIFLPVAVIKSIRIILVISTWFDYKIWEVDMKKHFSMVKLKKAFT